jgi:homopolymeric O-antigen transport system permease protein
VSTISHVVPEHDVPEGQVSASAFSSSDLPINIIRPPGAWQSVNLAELWTYRELLLFLIWREVKVRYKQTVLGAAWAVIQPLANMLIFTMFLGRLHAVSPDSVPYSLFVFAGLLPWTFFAGVVTSSSQSIIGNQALVTKVYFPRLLIPISAAGVGLVDFSIAFLMLLVMMLLYGVLPGWGMLLVPVLVIGLLVAAIGVGTLLAALTVAYRDFRHVVPFLVQVWMFATACIYMRAEMVVGLHWQAVLPLNPAYGLIAAFRQAALGFAVDWYGLIVSAMVGFVLLVVGCVYFRRVERSFADII